MMFLLFRIGSPTPAVVLDALPDPFVAVHVARLDPFAAVARESS